MGQPAPCREWQGRRQAYTGYGYFYLDRRRWYVHRWTFLQEHGYLPRVVRHTCDNPPCFEVTHLLGGTQGDNLQDMFDRGRARRAQGENVYTAKLTRADIPVIKARLASGDTVSSVARDYSIDRHTVRKVRDGITWRAESSD